MPKIPTFTSEARPTAQVGSAKSNLQIPLSQTVANALSPVTDFVVKKAVQANDTQNRTEALTLENDFIRDMQTVNETIANDSVLGVNKEAANAYLKEQSLIIQGKRTLEEMRTFIWKNGRAEAQPGYNDDLIMSLATACYVRDTALKFAQQGLDITMAALKNWKKETPSIYTNNSVNKNNKGWTQDLGKHGEQDLTWLL